MDTKLIQFIRSYLYETFAIDKIKDPNGKKFKRGMVMNFECVVYADDKDRLKREISKQLEDVFGLNDEIIRSAMKDYLFEDRSKNKKRPTKRRPSQIPR